MHSLFTTNLLGDTTINTEPEGGGGGGGGGRHTAVWGMIDSWLAEIGLHFM